MIAIGALAYCAVVLPLLNADPRRLADLRLRHEGLVIALFVVQGIARGRSADLTHAGMWVVFIWSSACILLIVILVASMDVPGVPLISLGLACNVFVTVLNGGMPYLPPDSARHLQDGPFYEQVLGHTSLAWMGDVLPDPSAGWLLSMGDVLLAVGAIAVIVSASTAPHSTRHSSATLT